MLSNFHTTFQGPIPGLWKILTLLKINTQVNLRKQTVLVQLLTVRDPDCARAAGERPYEGLVLIRIRSR
jgi:hypothetical protein